MTPVLLDANVSPEIEAFLNSTFGLDAVHLRTLGLGKLSDDEIVLLAQREGRVIVTFDLDFGEMYSRGERGRFGVVVLRLEDQSPSYVKRVLERFFRQEAADINLTSSLVVLDGSRTRVVDAR